MHLNFYPIDIQFVTKLPTPELPLHSLISRRSRESVVFRFFCTLSPGNIAPTLFFSALSGESEPYSCKFTALSPYGPYTTGHYNGPTQGNYQKTTGKVNQISTNPWHFPSGWNRTIASAAIQPAFLVRPIGESAPFCREYAALSPGMK